MPAGESEFRMSADLFRTIYDEVPGTALAGASPGKVMVMRSL
jgi:hypothetical protein